jgi:hypothetical protein
VLDALEVPKRKPILDQLMPMFSWLDEVRARADLLAVTEPGQSRKEKAAKALRLEIREKRVGLDKIRKQLKEGILLEGKAIDGAFAIFEAETVPREKWLREQETFTERAEQARADALRDARQETLSALGVSVMPGGLGVLYEEEWQLVLIDAKAAKESRERIAREEEEARQEAARILAERRAKEEADRKAEAARREADRLEAEEKREAEIARLRLENEEKTRLAEEERRAAEQRLEEERQAHAARLHDEREKRHRAEADRAIERNAEHLAAREREQQLEREREERRRQDEERAAEERRKEDAAAEALEREANATDREVLLGTASSLRAAKWGVCKGKLGREIMAKLQARVTKIADELEARAERIES